MLYQKHRWFNWIPLNAILPNFSKFKTIKRKIMSNLPNFSSYGYQIIEELGRNREGGRITWKATEIKTGQEVVLKQFCFATADSSWSGFNACEREIQVLQCLDRPGIPRYLGSFPTKDGFCLIQEYKKAANLGQRRSFEPEEIKTIAIKLLQILIYLHSCIPPVIHRDIKPENILVDRDLNVYLIDFGMSRIGDREVAASSIFKGTPGFIPPEQIRRPIEASDLYALGATIFCSIAGIKSSEIQEFTAEDDPYRLEFSKLATRTSKLNLRFIRWLEKMVEPKVKDRFASATEALKALEPINILKHPEVQLSQDRLDFQASQLGEKLTQTLKVSNLISETLLQGEWSVVPHPHDPVTTNNFHAWIEITPQTFTSDRAEFQIAVDTSKLLPEAVYERELLLQTNAVPQQDIIKLKLSTASIPTEIIQAPFQELGVIFFYSAAVTASIFGFKILAAGFAATLIAIATIAVAVGIAVTAGEILLVTLAATVTAVVGSAWIVALAGFWDWQAVLAVNIAGASALVATAAISVVKKVDRSRFKLGLAISSVLLSGGLGISSGIGLFVGLLDPFVLLALASTSLPLGAVLLYPHLKQAILIAKYSKIGNDRFIEP
jgi:serine/threonine protein kinase